MNEGAAINEGPSDELTAAIAKAAAVGETNTVDWAEELLRAMSETHRSPSS